jgi:hypothetical protein
MSLDPEDLLALAQRLDAQARPLTSSKDAGLREAMLRDVISRAYYGVFWRGRRYFETAQPPQSLPRFGAHFELHSRFTHYPGKAMREIAYDLQQLRLMRNQADYDSIVPRLEIEATRALRLANRLLNDIGSLPADPTQSP